MGRGLATRSRRPAPGRGPHRATQKPSAPTTSAVRPAAAAPRVQFTVHRAAAVGSVFSSAAGLADCVRVGLAARHTFGCHDSGRAGSVRPLAQNRHCPDHDLKGHSVPMGVHCPELLQAVVLVVEPAPDSDYRQPPGTRPLRCRCPAMPDTGRPVFAGGSLHGNHLRRPLA